MVQEPIIIVIMYHGYADISSRTRTAEEKFFVFVPTRCLKTGLWSLHALHIPTSVSLIVTETKDKTLLLNLTTFPSLNQGSS